MPRPVRAERPTTGRRPASRKCPSIEDVRMSTNVSWSSGERASSLWVEQIQKS